MEKKENSPKEKLNAEKIKAFKQVLRSFERKNGLRDLPWRRTVDPYAIAVSEIMLQQTQAHRVVPKFTLFMKRFPTVGALARASTADVLKLWSGLGYNRRALYLKRMAEVVTREWNGIFPVDEETLRKLPGIGPYTASAIMTFAYNRPTIVVETNIRSVFLHHFFSASTRTVADAELHSYIVATRNQKKPRHWYNLLMDYGSFLKSTGSVAHRTSKHYAKQPTFEGSGRKIRGAILRELSKRTGIRKKALLQSVHVTEQRGAPLLEQLEKEGFIFKNKGFYGLAKD